jgi:ferrochelatase
MAVETLEEIDEEYYEVAVEAGIKGWERVPALGLAPDFIDDLAEAVVEVRDYTRLDLTSST